MNDEDEEEKSRAYLHNSCKKISQLAHVLVTLTDKRLERYTDERALDIYQDKYFAELEKKNAKAVKQKSRALNKYKKEALQNESEKYAAKYSKLKSDFLVFSDEKKNQLLSYEIECIDLKNQADKLSNEIVKFSKKVKNEKIKVEPTPVGKPSDSTQHRISKIEKDMEKVKQNSEEKIEKMEEEQKEEIKRIKARHLKQLELEREHNNSALAKNFKERIIALKEGIELIKKKAVVYQKKKQMQSKENQVTRFTMMNDLKNTIKLNKSKTQNDGASEKSKFLKQKKELEAKFENQKKYDIQDIEKLDNELVRIREEHANGIKKMDLSSQKQALDSITNELIAKINQESNQAKKNIWKIENQVESTLEADIELKSKMKEVFDEIEERLYELSEQQKEKLENILSEVQEEHKKELNKLKRVFEEREDLMNDEEEDYSDDDPQDEIDELTEFLEDSESEFDAAMKNVNAATEKKRAAFVSKLENEEKKKKSMLENTYGSKFKEIKTEYDQFVNSNNQKVTEKVNDLVKANDEKAKLVIAEYLSNLEENAGEEEEDGELTQEEERQIFEKKKKEMTKELNTLTKGINQERAERNEIVSKLQNMIKTKFEEKQKYIAKGGLKKIIDELSQQIKNDYNNLIREMPNRERDSLDSTLRKIFEIRADATTRLFLSELNLMKKREETTTEIYNYEFKIELFQETSTVCNAERDFEREIDSYQDILKAKKEQLEAQKDEIKQFWREKDSKVVVQIRELDMKMSQFSLVHEGNFDKVRKQIEEKFISQKKKHAVLKGRLVKMIESAKEEQRKLIEACEEEIKDFIIKAAELECDKPKEKKEFDCSSLLSKESKAIDKALNNEITIRRNSKLEKLSQKTKDDIEKQITDFISMISRSSTQTGDELKKVHVVKKKSESSLRVLPPLTTPK